MLARALLLSLTCLLAAACSSSTTSPTPGGSTSPGAGASPATSAAISPDASVPTVDEQFCGTIADLQSALQTFEAIKIKASNGSKLKDASDGVSAAFTPISDAAASTLKTQVASLKLAVDGLTSGAEDYATASSAGKAAAEKTLRKAITTIHTAITHLRVAATCSV